MKQIKFLLFFLIIYSCKTDSQVELKADSDSNNPYIMYGLLIEEFTDSNEILQEQITGKIMNDSKPAKVYDSLTKEYLFFLNKTSSDLFKNVSIDDHANFYDSNLSSSKYVNEYFFNGEDYNQNGVEFVSKTDNYRTEILKLIEDQNLAKRVNRILETRNFRNREGKEIKYLNYFYKDMPLVSVLTFLKYKKNCVLEFEYEYLSKR